MHETGKACPRGGVLKVLREDLGVGVLLVVFVRVANGLASYKVKVAQETFELRNYFLART